MIPVLVSVAIGVIFLQWGWPIIVAWAIQGKHGEGWSRFVHDNIGYTLVAISGLGVVLTALAIVGFSGNESGRWGWDDPEPALAAFAGVAGVVFAVSRLFPPQFWPSFYAVWDYESGAWTAGKKLTELVVGTDGYWAIFLEVHNASVSAWSNYRITIDFRREGEWVLYPSHSEVPASFRWEWPTVFRRTRDGDQPFLQVQAGNTLAVAEPQTIRFVAKTPKKAGDYRIHIALVADGRLGEIRKTLPIRVVEGLQRPQ
jgi:hypothetical protein